MAGWMYCCHPQDCLTGSRRVAWPRDYKEPAPFMKARPGPRLGCLPRFTVQATLFSRRPRVGGMTIVTSGAANRLFMLDTICATWVGPLAVAILLPVLAFDPSAKPGDGADGRVKGIKMCPMTPRLSLSNPDPICSGLHATLFHVS